MPLPYFNIFKKIRYQNIECFSCKKNQNIKIHCGSNCPHFLKVIGKYQPARKIIVIFKEYVPFFISRSSGTRNLLVLICCLKKVLDRHKDTKKTFDIKKKNRKWMLIAVVYIFFTIILDKLASETLLDITVTNFYKLSHR